MVIIRAKNDYGITEYKYDLAGQLVWQKDVTTGEEVYFEYDAAKNRTKLYSTNRETVYSYGKNNEVLEVYDNKQRMSVSLKYDVCGREVERKFANGVVQKTAYDKAGRVVLITQKTGGDITWAEGYVYGEDGKRTATVDNAGRVTMYEYNQKGQLSKVYYPYTESMKQKLSSEAVENGLPTVADVGVNKFLSSEMYSKLGALMNRMSLSWAGKVTNVQIFITEQFVYDRNGNRIQKITPFGTINYSYDVENRMISSGSNGKTVVNYTYDKNGNMLTKESALKSEKYSYNAQNRLCESVVIDRENKTQAVSYYGYDAFGRRVVVQDRDAACMRSLYNGFTFDVIKQSPTLANGMFVDSNEIGLRLNRTGKATGDRYRYLDDDKNDGNRYFYLDEGTYKSVTSRYVGERTSITVNGVVAGQNAGGEVSYFITDLLGSVRTTTDNAGFGTNSYTYDAFGSLVEGNLSGATDYGYLGKQFDPQTGLYNYGYRDYAPVVARFTTVDPICDGNNWFSYVNNDPVNFVDLWGLSASDSANTLAEVSNGVATPLGETWNDAQNVTSTWGERESFKTSNGEMTNPGHKGMDFGAEEGTRINAVMDGTVTKVEKNPNNPSGYGLYVEITHDNGKHTLYGHQSKTTVQEGQSVVAGEKIGEVGSTGKSTGPHLHFGYDGNGEGKYDYDSPADNPEALLYSGE